MNVFKRCHKNSSATQMVPQHKAMENPKTTSLPKPPGASRNVIKDPDKAPPLYEEGYSLSSNRRGETRAKKTAKNPPQMQYTRRGRLFVPPKFQPGFLDGFVSSEDVYGLRDDTFRDFIKRRDVVLVMFYDRREPMSSWSKLHFRQAAKDTVKASHAYAAVDCQMQKDLCEKQEIKSYPTFKLYSRGIILNTFEGDGTFQYNNMKKVVESSPVIDELVRPIKRCNNIEPVLTTEL